MPLDLPNVSRAINDMFKVEGNAVPTPALIISQVSRFYSIDESILRGTLKNKGTAEARQVAMYLIRQLTNLLPEIGREFGRDHSTVIHSIRKVEMSLKDPSSPCNPLSGISHPTSTPLFEPHAGIFLPLIFFSTYPRRKAKIFLWINLPKQVGLSPCGQAPNFPHRPVDWQAPFCGGLRWFST